MSDTVLPTEVDVLVIGAGGAGLSVALGLAPSRRVLVLSKGDGSTPWAQGGIAAAIDPADDPHDHALDTAAAGGGLCTDPELRCLVEEGPLRVAELIGLGAQFDRTSSGQLSLTLEGGHHRRRVVHAGGDATGAEVARVLRAGAIAAGVTIADGATVRQLTRSERGQVTGAVVDDATTGRHHISARAVVLATGGIGNAYAASTNPASVTGDGIGLALAVGAELVDMEFVQFHPTALFVGPSPLGQLPLVSEAVRGEGAVLIDAAGQPFMVGRHPMADLAPRDIVAREIDAVMRRDDRPNVWLDATAIPAATLRVRFPTVLAACARIGIDATATPIPVAPAEHFLCGGVRTDRWGATSVPGLYAVGEVAATGVHGANRLASNSLLEGLVFGRRVAARLVLDLPAPARTDESLIEPDRPDSGAASVRAVLSRYAGVRRDGAGLAQASDELEAVDDSPLATVARAVIAAAVARRESRGCHWRGDYPRSSERWARRIVVRLDPSGRPVADATLAGVA
jgi:L-aspartate oxidase